MSLEHPDEQKITARLAAAGSRRAELEALLAAASPSAQPSELRRLVLESNVAGKSSAISREKVWRQLRERYVLDPTVPEYQAFCEAMQTTSSPSELGLLCLLSFARSDRLFRELTLDCVSPMLMRDRAAIDSGAVDQYVSRLATEHGFAWTPETAVSVRQHALSALKDFGVLAGAVKKRTIRPRPGVETTLFAGRLGRLEGLTDRQMAESRWFRLLGLDTEQVVELFYAAHRTGRLRFYAQAEVVEINLPDLAAA